MELLPAALPGTVLRILATTDLAAELIPQRVSWGEGGTCAGVVELLERERERQATVWLDAGDLTVGPAAALPGERPWGDMGELPIDAAAAGNHEWVVAVLHDGVDWWPNPGPGGPRSGRGGRRRRPRRSTRRRPTSSGRAATPG